MNIEIKAISPKRAREFLEDIVSLVFRGELTLEAAAAKTEFLWDCIVHSMLKNKEEWDGKIADYGFLDEQAQWLKSRVLERKKIAQARIDTQKDKIVIDGVQVHPVSVNLESKTEFVYQIGQALKPRNKQKTLTIEWSEPCNSNPVHTVAPLHTVAPPPPPPPPSHLISEVDLKTIQTEDVPQDPYRFQVPPSTFSSIQQMQSALEKDDYSHLNKLLKKAFASWVGGYQPIAKEDQQTATPPKSR